MTFLTEDKKKEIKQYIAKLKPSLSGLFLYYCFPFRKKVVISNMQQVFGGFLTPLEIKKLAQSFYGHVTRFLFENIQLRFLSIEKIKNKVEVVGYEHLWEAYQQGKGIALLAGHFGNWELGAIGGMLNFQEFREHFYVIRKTFHAKWLENLLFKRFSEAGILVISKRNALGQAVDAIEAKNAVVFIMDQYASLQSKDGISVDFFGKKTGTYKSLAMIVQHTQAVVIPVSAYRLMDNRHVLHFYPPLEWVEALDDREALHLNTEQYNRKLEELLLSHPEQWLWFHRRWKMEL